MLNELDGFSTRPLVVIPFDGDIDPMTAPGNVFFVSLGDTTHDWTDSGPDSIPSDERDHEGLRRRSGFGRIIGVNQIVWDPATRVLHAKADRLLEEHARYALVVTSGIRAPTGQPLSASEAFRSYQRALDSPDNRWYRKSLAAAEWAARRATPQPHEVVAVSSFTTQSVTYLREKITTQILSAAPPPAPDFNILHGGGRAIFEFDRIESITHNQQIVPDKAAEPGQPYNLTGMRWSPGAVGRIAFGRFTAPDYMIHPGEYIPPRRSRTDVAAPQGSNTLHFTLILPSGPRPANGWPVIVFGHGGNGTRATTPLEIASIPASHGFALICIDNVGHGRGPVSTLTLRMVDGSNVTVPAPGRGFDQDGDGAIGTAEGLLATGSLEIALHTDATLQSGADHLSLIRLIQRGIDADGDGRTEVDPSRIYFFGQSLGAHQGLQLVAYAQPVRASYLVAPFGTAVEARRFSRRSVMGSLLAARRPSLLNAGHGLRSIGGVPVEAPIFDENVPFRGMPPVTNTVPGAMAIQRFWDRIEWRGQIGDATVLAAKLRKRPPTAVSARPLVIWLGRGDQSAMLTESSSIIREGELEDRTVLYRHDLFFAANPTSVKTSHTVYRFQGPSAPTNSITVAIQQQFSRFFASDGTRLERTSPYLETPMMSPLPGQLDFIP